MSKFTNSHIARLISRPSKLALHQAMLAQTALENALEQEDQSRKKSSAELQTSEFFPIIAHASEGDVRTETPLADFNGNKNVFVKALDELLLAERADIAVHSAKDMSSTLPPGLIIGAVLERADPRDAFVCNSHDRLTQLETGMTISTSSPRRAAQIKAINPTLRVADIRGNVDTRLRKLDAGETDACLLAVAGLQRLGRGDRIAQFLDIAAFLPAAGQGTVALVCREVDASRIELLERINHRESFARLAAERSVLRALGATCQTPIGVFAQVNGGELKISACLYHGDDNLPTRIERVRSFEEREDINEKATQLGTEVGEHLLVHQTERSQTS